MTTGAGRSQETATSSAPCDEIARYLSNAAAESEDHGRDTGKAEFLQSALDVFEERGPAKGAPVEVIDGRAHDSAQNALVAIGLPIDPAVVDAIASGELGGGSLDFYDVRPFGGFLVLKAEEGTMHCVVATMLNADETGIHLGPKLLNEGGEICWSSTFHVIRVGEHAYPAVVDNESGHSSIGYRINLLAIVDGMMTRRDPMCSVVIKYQPSFRIEHWLTATAPSAETTRLKSRLEPIVAGVAAGLDAAPLVGSILDRTNGDSTYDRFLADYQRDGEQAIYDLKLDRTLKSIPYAYQIHTGYTRLSGTYWPVIFDGRRYLLGVGTAEFGWRESTDMAFGLWEWDGTMLVPLAGGFAGKEGAVPAISVETD